MSVRRLVLTYHSHNIGGNRYETNDHVALADDLRTLAEVRARIVGLDRIADAQRRRDWPADDRLEVALTFDDGPRFDVADFVHPEWGAQRGFLRSLDEAAPRFGASALRRFGASALRRFGASRAGLRATSFVIASPEARTAMERAPDCGFAELRDWLGEDWWAGAETRGISIGNHSWDHLHPALALVAQKDDIRGDFTAIADHGDADRQVRRASDFILARLPGVKSLAFAYPYGHVAPYLRDHYFPEHESEHRCFAAFSTEGRAIDPDDSIWALPRLVCGWHWQSADGLRALLARFPA